MNSNLKIAPQTTRSVREDRWADQGMDSVEVLIQKRSVDQEEHIEDHSNLYNSN